MKIVKRINNRYYKIKQSLIPAHKLPEKVRREEREKLMSMDSNKINLTDVTFMIPVRIESEDRKKCLTILIDYMVKYFNTSIIVLEEGPSALFNSFKKNEWSSYVKYIYRKTSDSFFYKTLDLNIMTKQTTTPIICSLDSDCLFYPEQIVKAVQKIRDGVLDFCYPFNQPMHNIKKELIPELEQTLNLSSVHSKIKPSTRLIPPGGCFIMNKEKFIEGGMENQNMISYGPEDAERRDRLIILRYKVGDTTGPLFHIDHSRTPNSNDHNPYFAKNTQEYDKVRFMLIHNLKAYISTWEWIK